MVSGRYRAGSRSSCSRNTPSGVIFASACRSAEHDTAIATGQDAPCRGSRTTRTSWQKYLPPNCAPMPNSLGQLEDLLLQLQVAEPVPERRSRASAACRGSARTRTSRSSARTPPTCRRPRPPGGTAGRPRCRASGSSRPGTPASASGFSTAFVSWYRNDLFAEPPPLAMNRNLYAGSPCAGRRVELDLRRQVGPGVLLVPHGQRRQLRVAQVQLGVGVVHAAADPLARRPRR